MNYSMGQLVQQFGISAWLIRKYMEQGRLGYAFKTPGGKYRFNAENVEQLKAILSRDDNHPE